LFHSVFRLALTPQPLSQRERGEICRILAISPLSFQERGRG